MAKKNDFDYEDEDFSFLDEDVDEEQEEDIQDNDKDNKQENNEDWFVPGKYKTKDDAVKNIKKMEQYIKQLEEKVKQQTELLQKQQGNIQNNTQEATQDEIDKAMDELGITDDELLVKPRETMSKILKHITKNVIPKVVGEPLLNNANAIRAELLKKEIKQLYPNFDIDANEDKVAKIIQARYNPEYFRSNPLQVLSEVIEELGGKKATKQQSNFGEPYAESPHNSSAETRERTVAGDIKKRILEAPVGDADIFEF